MDKIVGTCSSMCPKAEIRFRERNKLLHPFEILYETRTFRLPKVDSSKIVKEYSRPAAGKHDPFPDELRPAPVLLKTVRYLINEVVPLDNVPWCRVYEYVFDRLRAVRQDMVMQRITGPTAARILEATVKFHIYANYILCEDNIADFDPHINSIHIQECLKRLLVLYEEDVDCRSNMTEFISLYLLYNLGNTDALNYALAWKKELNHDVVFKNAVDMSFAALLGNNVKVFKKAKHLSPIALCAFHRHITNLQMKSMTVMSTAYNSKNLCFNIDDITRLLWFNDYQHVTSVCEHYGLSVRNSGILFNKVNFCSTSMSNPILSTFVEDRLKLIPPNELIM